MVKFVSHKHEDQKRGGPLT